MISLLVLTMLNGKQLPLATEDIQTVLDSNRGTCTLVLDSPVNDQETVDVKESCKLVLRKLEEINPGLDTSEDTTED